MEYGKLYTILLGVSGSEKGNTTNQRIAQYILQNLGSPEQISTKKISKECYVGMASISRFCREIGLQDFFELRELISAVQFQADIHHTEKFHQRLLEYETPIQQGIDMVINSIREEDVRELCEDIHRYRRVSAFGWIKSQAAVMVLQSELMAAGKNIHTVLSYKEQQEFIRSATEEDLILFFSYRGIYFDYHSMPDIAECLKRPRVYFITGSPDAFPPGVDRVLRFQSDFDQNKHPHQLLFVGNIIAREYVRRFGFPENPNSPIVNADKKR